MTTIDRPVLIAGTRAASTAVSRATFRDAIERSGLHPTLFEQGLLATNIIGMRYEIVDLIGRGSQGALFDCIEIATDRPVAAKVFELGKARDWQAERLFEREVEALRRIQHPLVPRFINILRDDDTGVRIIVMEKVAGETIESISKRLNGFPLHEVPLLLADILSALGCLHAANLAHRDVKPSNVLRGSDGRFHLVDLGGVAVLHGSGSTLGIGTLGFVAPEQLHGAVSPRSDLFSLGMTVVCAVAGCESTKVPRRGLAVDVVAAAPTLPPSTQMVLAAMLAPNPDARPADTAAVLALLNLTPAKNGGGPLPAAVPADARPSREAHEGPSVRSQVKIVRGKNGELVNVRERAQMEARGDEMRFFDMRTGESSLLSNVGDARDVWVSISRVSMEAAPGFQPDLRISYFAADGSVIGVEGVQQRHNGLARWWTSRAGGRPIPDGAEQAVLRQTELVQHATRALVAPDLPDDRRLLALLVNERELKPGSAKKIAHPRSHEPAGKRPVEVEAVASPRSFNPMLAMMQMFQQASAMQGESAEVNAQSRAKTLFKLGCALVDGEGVAPNEAGAAVWFRAAAELGHATAQLRLGHALLNGSGIEQNKVEAAHWFRMAAEQGHADAQDSLATAYCLGQGVPQDDDKAVEWWRRAAEQGHTDAQDSLAWAAGHGRGIRRGEVEE